MTTEPSIEYTFDEVEEVVDTADNDPVDHNLDILGADMTAPGYQPALAVAAQARAKQQRVWVGLTAAVTFVGAGLIYAWTRGALAAYLLLACLFTACAVTDTANNGARSALRTLSDVICGSPPPHSTPPTVYVIPTPQPAERTVIDGSCDVPCGR